MKLFKIICIASDHAGYKLKTNLINYLKKKKYTIKDYGTMSDESVDYPDFIHPLAKDINDNIYDIGIIICGTGNGVAMTANKYENIRAALCWNNEVSELARKHNDSNILSLPARFIEEDEAKKIADTFLNTLFDNNRHTLRIEKIKNILN